MTVQKNVFQTPQFWIMLIAGVIYGLGTYLGWPQDLLTGLLALGGVSIASHAIENHGATAAIYHAATTQMTINAQRANNDEIFKTKISEAVGAHLAMIGTVKKTK
jgi:phage shock protein PspC (stress-responsive transcriptional regulator)